MIKIAGGYKKDPFTGRMLYPGEMYEEIEVQPKKLTEPVEPIELPEELKENGKPKRAKKVENE